MDEEPDSSCRLAGAAHSGLKVLPLDVCRADVKRG